MDGHRNFPVWGGGNTGGDNEMRCTKLRCTMVAPGVLLAGVRECEERRKWNKVMRI